MKIAPLYILLLTCSLQAHSAILSAASHSALAYELEFVSDRRTELLKSTNYIYEQYIDVEQSFPLTAKLSVALGKRLFIQPSAVSRGCSTIPFTTLRKDCWLGSR